MPQTPWVDPCIVQMQPLNGNGLPSGLLASTPPGMAQQNGMAPSQLNPQGSQPMPQGFFNFMPQRPMGSPQQLGSPTQQAPMPQMGSPMQQQMPPQQLAQLAQLQTQLMLQQRQQPFFGQAQLQQLQQQTLQQMQMQLTQGQLPSQDQSQMQQSPSRQLFTQPTPPTGVAATGLPSQWGPPQTQFTPTQPQFSPTAPKPLPPRRVTQALDIVDPTTNEVQPRFIPTVPEPTVPDEANVEEKKDPVLDGPTTE